MTNPETGYEKAHRQVEQIFRQFFPARGMITREGQIRLCHMMLDALFGLDVALCDAGVGLGKTYAYLVAENIAAQLEKRIGFRRAMKQSMGRVQAEGKMFPLFPVNLDNQNRKR